MTVAEEDLLDCASSFTLSACLVRLHYSLPNPIARCATSMIILLRSSALHCATDPQFQKVGIPTCVCIENSVGLVSYTVCCNAASVCMAPNGIIILQLIWNMEEEVQLCKNI